HTEAVIGIGQLRPGLDDLTEHGLGLGQPAAIVELHTLGHGVEHRDPLLACLARRRLSRGRGQNGIPAWFTHRTGSLYRLGAAASCAHSMASTVTSPQSVARA